MAPLISRNVGADRRRVLKRSRRSGKFGAFLFFAPMVVLLLIVVIGFISYESSVTGTLVVEAVSSGRYSPAVSLHATATVGTITYLTPFNLTLSSGVHTILFGSLNWYLAPHSKSVTVLGGKTAYAVGTYLPVVRVVTFTQAGFNSTSITALHGVTPVVWINKGASGMTLVVAQNTRVYLLPSQNYTTVFQSPGTYSFSLYGTGFGGVVSSV